MRRAALSLAILALASGEASAQSAAVRKAARELVEFLKTRFAREVAEEGASKLERRFVDVIDKYGDDAVKAAKRVGPRLALQTVSKHGKMGARIVARWGDDGARLLATDAPGAMKVLNLLEDEGIDLMIRRHGSRAAAQLPELAPAIANTGRKRDVLAVMERYGDRACDFIWKHKGVIFGTAALAAFLANPEPFLRGARDIAKVPMSGIVAATDWTAVFLVAAVLAAGLAAIRLGLLRRVGPRKPSIDST